MCKDCCVCFYLGPLLDGIKFSWVLHLSAYRYDSCVQVVRSKKVRTLRCYSIHKCSHTYRNMNMQQKKLKNYFGSLNSISHVERLRVMFLFCSSYNYVCNTCFCQKSRNTVNLLLYAGRLVKLGMAGMCRVIAELVSHELVSVFPRILSCINLVNCALQSTELLCSIYSCYMFLLKNFSPFLPYLGYSRPLSFLHTNEQ